MKLGFTLDEKIFHIIKPKDLLKEVRKKGIKSVEISMDEKIFPLEVYHSIIKTALSLDMEIHFHIPYFADPLYYETMDFIHYKEKATKKYRSFLSILKIFQSLLNNDPIIVIHGANYKIKERKEEGFHHTLGFLEWILNHMEKEKIHGQLALETLNQQHGRKIGDQREDLFYILDQFKSNRLGICWDIPHDLINYYPKNPPLDHYFFKKIIYCHIHGVKVENKQSHISIQKGNFSFKDQLLYLKNNNFHGILNVELLVQFCKNTYLDDLVGDIDYIHSIKKI